MMGLSSAKEGHRPSVHSRNAEEDAAERPRAALERQPAFQHTPHCESGGEEMKIDNTAQEKRKKKKQQTQLE